MAKLVWRPFTSDEQRVEAAGMEGGLTAVQMLVLKSDLVVDSLVVGVLILEDELVVRSLLMGVLLLEDELVVHSPVVGVLLLEDEPVVDSLVMGVVVDLLVVGGLLRLSKDWDTHSDS